VALSFGRMDISKNDFFPQKIQGYEKFNLIDFNEVTTFTNSMDMKTKLDCLLETITSMANGITKLKREVVEEYAESHKKERKKLLMRRYTKFLL